MAVYKLEETPDLFIAPAYCGNKFIYRMVSIGGELNKRLIRNIDLRHDTLTIYGVEIQEFMLQKLHDALVLRPRLGIVHVNCDGACYVFITGKGVYRTIDNVIFDWSRCGVIVPDSVNDLLRKELAEKEDEVKKLKIQLSTAEDDGLSTKASFEALKKEADELKEQLSLTNSELQSTKVLLELSDKRVSEMKEQVSARKREREEMEMKLQNVTDQFSTVKSELQYTQGELESVNKKVKELEHQVSQYRKENEGKAEELQRVREELSRTQPKGFGKRILRLFQKSPE